MSSVHVYQLVTDADSPCHFSPRTARSHVNCVEMLLQAGVSTATLSYGDKRTAREMAADRKKSRAHKKVVQIIDAEIRHRRENDKEL